MHRIKKLIAVFVLIFALLAPACTVCALAKGSTGSKQTQSKKTVKTKTKNNNKTAKNNKKTKNSKKSKSGKKSKKHRKRHHRGHATYTNSHETDEQKKAIAKETARLNENPDYSGDIPGLAADSFVWPVKYGYISRGVSGGHRGVDMISRANDPIYAVGDGVVSFVSIGQKAYSGYGKLVFIHHESRNLWSVYSHCAAIYVHEGQRVKRGQKIASVGRTGRATTEHLHFEMRGEGKKILNPLNYLPKEGKLGHRYVPH